MFKIWLKSNKFKGMFLTGAGVLDDILDGQHMPGISLLAPEEEELYL